MGDFKIRRAKPNGLRQIVTVTDTRDGIVADVEVDTFRRRVMSVTFRRADRRPITAREVRRSRLDAYMRAAVAIAGPKVDMRGLRTAIRPSERPERGRSVEFYRKVWLRAKELEADGIRPAQVIADEMGVEANTVHQWLFRARPRFEGKGEGR